MKKTLILTLTAIAIFCIGITAFATPSDQNKVKSPISCSMETCQKDYTNQEQTQTDLQMGMGNCKMQNNRSDKQMQMGMGNCKMQNNRSDKQMQNGQIENK